MAGIQVPSTFPNTMWEEGQRRTRQRSTSPPAAPRTGVVENLMPASQQLIVVSCYTRFDNLAHGPRGTEAKRSLYTFRLDPSCGEMVLLSVTQDEVMNPAFSRFHPRKNILYTCTESVEEDGEIITWSVDPQNGKLTKLGSQGAGGTSTCYLTLDKECENMLVVNYWNATVGIFGVNGSSGLLMDKRSVYDPNNGKPMKAQAKKHVNHSRNDKSAQKERQSDPHSHAIILDPFFGGIAFVPDLGMDVIRQFKFDKETGTLTPAGMIKSGPDGRVALGPRYIEFHPTAPICYVVNELSSEVSVFQFDRAAAEDLVTGAMDPTISPPTLRLVQTVSTIPPGFPQEMNTCGRIAVHPTGNFVFVSNRGHNSVTVFRTSREQSTLGLLTKVHSQHTRGATPRHFQFDASGQWLIAANQDSDNISVFRFNLATGRLDFTGHQYAVPSPNFVCSVKPHVQLRGRVSRSSSPAGRVAVAHTSRL